MSQKTARASSRALQKGYKYLQTDWLQSGYHLMITKKIQRIFKHRFLENFTDGTK